MLFPIGRLAAVVFIAVFLPHSLRASESRCSEVRLDQTGSMKHVVIAKQPPQLCFAYALAQMIDAWRFSHGTQPPPGGYEARTSGFELAVAFSVDQKRALYLPGPMTGVDRFLRSRHSYVCDDRVIRDEDFAKQLLDYWRKYSRFLDDKANLNQILKKADAEGRPMNPLTLMAIGSYAVASNLKCDLFTDQPVQIRDLAGFLREDNPVHFLNGIFSSLCSDHRIPLQLPRLKEERFRAMRRIEGLAGKVAGIMSRPAGQPVGINFCANVLKDPTYRGVGFTDWMKDCVPHFALAIGRRNNPVTGKCQVLLTGAEGASCPPSSSFAKDWECEVGNFWVDEGALYRNTQYIEYFEE